METISVIIIAYNVENYIKRCLDSIINQTYYNLEIIIVDDASTDKTRDICIQYQNKDERIKYIRHTENQGQATARNTGLDNTTGEYISFVDSDDYVLPEYYDILYKNLKRMDADISICNFKYVNENEKFELECKQNELKVYEGEEKYYTFFSELRTPFIVTWGKIYKRKIFINLRYIPNSSNEDSNIAHKVVAKAKRIVYTPKELYLYVKRKGSITQSKYNFKRADVLDGEYDKITFFDNVINSKKLVNCAKCCFWINLVKNMYYLQREVADFEYYKDKIVKRYDGVTDVLDAVAKMGNNKKEYKEDFGEFIKSNIPLEYCYKINGSQFSDVDIGLIKEDIYVMKISYIITKKDKEISVMRVLFEEHLANWEGKEGLEITLKSIDNPLQLKIVITDSDDARWQGNIDVDSEYRTIRLPFSILKIDETIKLKQLKIMGKERIKFIEYILPSQSKNKESNSIYLKSIKVY